MRISASIETLESCITTASLPEAMPKTGGKHELLTNGLRKLSPRILAMADRVIRANSLPLSKNANAIPINSGIDSVVWAVGDDKSDRLTTFKIDRRGEPSVDDAYDRAIRRRDDYRYLVSVYGDLVRPTSFCIIRPPYKFARPSLGKAQDFIDYEGDVFSVDPSSLNQEHLSRFVAGTRQAIANGRLPDLIGNNNVVYDSDGNIQIVDTVFTAYEDMDIWERIITKFSQFEEQVLTADTSDLVN